MKDLLLKICFFAWKVWTNKVSVATVMVQWNPNISQLCQCCEVPEREAREHIFLKGDIASYVWNYFSNAASIIGPKMHVNQP